MAMNADHFHTHDNTTADPFYKAGQSMTQTLEDIIKMQQRIAELEEATRWRKFPDEKPEWGKEVLVLADDGDIRRVRFSCDYKWISWGNMRTCESSCITHWMPQPKKPEE